MGIESSDNCHDRNQTETPLVQVRAANLAAGDDGTLRLAGLQGQCGTAAEKAVDAILKAGGTVTFSYQCVPVRGNPDALSLDPNALPTTPAWLRACLGEDFFRNTVEVNLSGRAIFERDLAQPMNLSGLWYLFLTDVKVVRVGSDNQRLIQDADLIGLGQLGELRRLALGKADINGFGLTSLVNLRHLKSLDVVNTHVDDAGMEYIGGFAAC